MSLIVHDKTVCTLSSLLISVVFDNASIELQKLCVCHVDDMCTFIVHHQKIESCSSFYLYAANKTTEPLEKIEM
jgi:hypothetical protein